MRAYAQIIGIALLIAALWYVADGGPEGALSTQQADLLIAVSHGNLPAARALVARGAARKKLAGSLGPLHIAVRHGDVEMVRVLIDGGADVNDTPLAGTTPLLLTIGSGLPRERTRRIVDLLLQAGARVDATDIWGRTAADLAALHGDMELARVLGGTRCPLTRMDPE